jgi:phenylacetate-CoA ligase
VQCPEYEQYHVQAEHLLVEILSERDEVCAPGEIGRVVVTPLRNFAMPLISLRHRSSRAPG